jgi:hypothetical protein
MRCDNHEKHRVITQNDPFILFSCYDCFYPNLQSIELTNQQEKHEFKKTDCEVLKKRFPRLTHVSGLDYSKLCLPDYNFEFYYMLESNKDNLNAAKTLYMCLYRTYYRMIGKDMINKICKMVVYSVWPSVERERLVNEWRNNEKELNSEMNYTMYRITRDKLVLVVADENTRGIVFKRMQNDENTVRMIKFKLSKIY